MDHNYIYLNAVNTGSSDYELYRCDVCFLYKAIWKTKDKYVIDSYYYNKDYSIESEYDDCDYSCDKILIKNII